MSQLYIGRLAYLIEPGRVVQIGERVCEYVIVIALAFGLNIVDFHFAARGRGVRVRVRVRARPSLPGRGRGERGERERKDSQALACFSPILSLIVAYAGEVGMCLGIECLFARSFARSFARNLITPTQNKR